ncbi:alpha/beta hydrolase [Actinomadura madurae]|uniref:alpha/beta hydrolase n=1 Tax=Actinomadura madurae TaxID=1993 RepID=UPI000D957DBE|nr:alpha/beta hydrolase [Actinomadura madurae]SPT52354.1 Alpha/beta hydrolase family [Actinomadura madurae]
MAVPAERELLAVPMSGTASANEVYSGVARLAGTLWCVRHRAVPGRRSGTAVVVLHPSSNFMGHYALAAIAEAGHDAVGMSTRYIGNDTALLLENCAVDVGAVVRRLRDEGYERIVLFGNSGGGALAAMYQNQAERPTITASPCGGGPDLTRADLPPADLLVLAMAHPGRSQLLTETLDPAVHDEGAPFDRDTDLDMFDGRHGPPYDAAWLARYRLEQRRRNDRITAWAEARLAELADRGVHDLPFAVHGVCADPRHLDLALDPNDRVPGTLWGDPWNANFQPATLGHFTTVRAWLSQWSRLRSNGHGPDLLATVRAPVLVVYGTADQSCFPSHARELHDAVAHDDKKLVPIAGGRHYLHGQPEQIGRLVTALDDWIDAHPRTSEA